MIIYSIDRFEGNFAVCEDDSCACININIDKLPKDAKEGDMIVVYDNGKITIDKELTAARREQIRKLEDKLFKNKAK